MMHAMTHDPHHAPHHHRSHLGCAAMVIGWTVLGLIFIAGLALALGALLMVLWNWLMPVIFGLPVLTYWQAVGLFILAHLLFKSPPHHGPPHHRGHRGNGHAPHHRGHAWRVKMRMREGDQFDPHGLGDPPHNPHHPSSGHDGPMPETPSH